MNTKALAVAGAVLALAAAFTQADPMGSAFTYQGRLCAGGAPASGYYDFNVKLFETAVSVTVLGEQSLPAVFVTNGLFTTNLNFGLAPFAGQARWLEISACTNGAGTPAVLSPRQELKPTPYALYATNAGVAATASTVAASSIDTPALAVGAVDSSRIADGSITSDDLSTGLALSTFWRLDGNGGTTPGTHFLGTTGNQPLELKVNGSRVFRLEPNASEAPNVIGGGRHNLVAVGVVGGTIAGGGAANYGGNPLTNQVLSDFGSIGGGSRQLIEQGANSSTIAGGFFNAIGTNANAGAIGGGRYNSIGTGTRDAVIAGGYDNDIGADSDYAIVGGGTLNKIGGSTPDALVAGGYGNTIGTNSDYAVIAGGSGNSIQDNSGGSVVVGGISNGVETNSDYSFIGGGQNSGIGDNAGHSVIAGGDRNDIWNRSPHGAILGGGFNAIHNDSPYAFIGGGRANAIGTNALFSMIGGGTNNNIADNSLCATIAGGQINNIGTDSDLSAIGGGYYNNIAGNSWYATIAGGDINAIGADSDGSAIGGGADNEIGDHSLFATVAGGFNGDIGTNSFYSAIGGGHGNTIAKNSFYATIPGGYHNTATNYAFAAGCTAKAKHTGAFVWADYGGFDFPSTTTNQFNVRATGGVRIVTGIDALGFPNAGVSLNAADSSWNSISDRNAKKNFQPVDGREILERLAQVPVQRWNYKREADGAVLHIGPMAQDFKAAFYPGRDDKTISTMEFDGVELAAIQGLNQIVKEKDVEIQGLKESVAELKELVRALAEKQNGGRP